MLAELAAKAMQEENGLHNPYLRTLMIRLRGVALELKAATEKEGHPECIRAHSGDTGQSPQ